MIGSLLIKLVLLAMTMGVVWWTAWQAPQASFLEAKSEVLPLAAEGPAAPANATREQNEPAVSETPVAPSPPSQITAPVPPRRRGPLDLNRASAADIDALPGIGAVLAQRVIDYRTASGGFRSIDDLRQVKGIGAKKLDRLRPLVMVSMPAAPAKTEKPPS
jgi:competence protein ComEA